MKTWRTRQAVTACLSALLLFLEVGSAGAWSGRPVAVSDAADLTVNRGGRKLLVRLYGVLAPPPETPAAAEMKRFLVMMMREREVIVEDTDNFPDGSVTALVWSGYETDTINGILVEKGHARVDRDRCDRPICEDWLSREEAAKNVRIGMWRDLPRGGDIRKKSGTGGAAQEKGPSPLR